MKISDLIKSDSFNAETIERMKQLKSREEVYEMLKKEGLDIPYEEFVKEVSEYNESMQKMSDEEIQSIAAGSSTTTTTTTTATTVSPMAAAGAV